MPLNECQIPQSRGEPRDACTRQLLNDAEPHVREMRIPPCPDILQRFSEEMRAPAPDLRRLATLIGCDAALSASLLKTVNSAFYRRGQRASTVLQALAVLGLRASANLISGLLLREAFPVASGVHMARFWASTAELAQCAAVLARQLRTVGTDEAHTYVLFRDCGIAAMLAQFPDYGDIVDAYPVNPGAAVSAAELARYRYHHARVGYSFTRNWLLPDALCLSVLHHHDFDHLGEDLPALGAADRRLLAFGLLADQVVRLRRGEGLCPDWEPQERFVLQTLEVTADDVVALTGEFAADGDGVDFELQSMPA